MCSKGELRQKCRDNEAAWAGPGAWESTGKAGRSTGESVKMDPELIGVV